MDRKRSKRRRGAGRLTEGTRRVWYGIANTGGYLRHLLRSRPRRRKRSFWGVVLTILLFPLLVLRTIGEIVLHSIWLLASSAYLAWGRRAKLHLFQSLPAIGMAIVVIAFGVVAQATRHTLINEYRGEAATAFRAKDYDAARVYFERLVSLDGGAPASRYDLALTLEKLNESKRAEAIMAQLAPSDDIGFGNAHMWISHRLLSRPETYQSPELVNVAFGHLQRAKQAMPRSPEVDVRLSQYYVATRQYDQAVNHLTQACRVAPEYYFDLSLLHGALEHKDLAREASFKANEYLRPRVISHPDDDDARLRLASVRMNLDDFDGAVELLRTGLAIHPHGPFQQALARAFIAKFDKLQQSADGSPALQLELLRIALQQDPNSTEAIRRLIELGESSEEDLARTNELLETLLANGYINAFAHFVLGCKSWEAKRIDTAIWHFERAYKLDDRLGPVANNLAWTLAHADPPQLERALTVINSVVEHWPNDANYRDTRGQIRVKLEKWDDALDDLEFALKGRPRDPQVHRALAIVYRNLKRPELASRHEQLAESLKN